MHPHNTNVFESNIIEKKKKQQQQQKNNQVTKCTLLPVMSANW